LFHPADGQVRVKGVPRCTNSVLHPWLKQELSEILAALPEPAVTPSAEVIRVDWLTWTAALSTYPTLLAELPPLRMLLILDNLKGHLSPALVCWPPTRSGAGSSSTASCRSTRRWVAPG
jgi:hypothetical protein